jgi:adenylate kinase
MLEIEKEKFGITHRDQMRTLPIAKQKEAQKLVAEKLAKEKGKFVLDTHCSISTPKGYYPGLPFEFLKGLKVEAVILLTATAEEIRKRRSNDPTRVRDKDDVELHEKMNLGYLAAYSAFTGAPASVVYNRDGKVEEAVKQMEALLG